MFSHKVLKKAAKKMYPMESFKAHNTMEISDNLPPTFMFAAKF
jgi:hypothetical protein